MLALLALLGLLSAAAAEPLSCEAFNARLEAFHTDRSAQYAKLAKRHRALEESIAAEAASARRLEATLRRQASRSRDRELRVHLTRQARAAGQAAAGAERRLKAEVRRHREEEERFKDLYKVEAGALLRKRPPRCAVAALAD